MTEQDFLPLAVEEAEPGKFLRLPALEVRQGDGSTLYSFAVDGKQLPFFATISRIHRDDDSEIQGYQRPAVLSHISAIRKYIESDSPMLPNALVIAFDKRVSSSHSPANRSGLRPSRDHYTCHREGRPRRG